MNDPLDILIIALVSIMFGLILALIDWWRVEMKWKRDMQDWEKLDE